MSTNISVTLGLNGAEKDKGNKRHKRKRSVIDIELMAKKWRKEMFIEERMVRAKGARRDRQPWLRKTGGVRSERVSERLLNKTGAERDQ